MYSRQKYPIVEKCKAMYETITGSAWSRTIGKGKNYGGKLGYVPGFHVPYHSFRDVPAPAWLTRKDAASSQS